MPDDNQSAAAMPATSATSTAIGSTAVSPTVSKPTAVQPAPTPDPEITLEQFGIELSHRDKRVELLNAFVFAERQAKHFKDTKKNYLARFAAFADQPA